MSKYRLHASIRQLPVGQGGFLIGHVRDDHSHIFTYAFDCGSINREHFERGMAFCAPGKIDVLFVSHLDKDHINGIDALAAHMQIEAIVLPCLDPLLVTMIACEAIGESGVAISVREFLADPSGWFAIRGIKKVYYIPRADDDADTFPFDPNAEQSPEDNIVPDDEDGPDEGRNYKIRSDIIGTPQPKRTAKCSVRTLGPHTSISTTSTKGYPSWLLVPYVHPFPSSTIELFYQAAGKLFYPALFSRDIATKTFTKRLLEILCSKDERKKLKACYSILSTDNNLPSLSLYSGPRRPFASITISGTDDASYWPFPCPHLIINSTKGRPSNKGGAWLSTGDANLETHKTRTHWLERFEYLIANVNVFVLPHHGSNDSIHDEILMRLDDSIMVACAASGRAKHPHELLLGRLHTLDQKVWQVSEKAESGYTLNVSISA